MHKTQDRPPPSPSYMSEEQMGQQPPTPCHTLPHPGGRQDCESVHLNSKLTKTMTLQHSTYENSVNEEIVIGPRAPDRLRHPSLRV